MLSLYLEKIRWLEALRVNNIAALLAAITQRLCNGLSMFRIDYVEGRTSQVRGGNTHSGHNNYTTVAGLRPLF